MKYSAVLIIGLAIGFFIAREVYVPSPIMTKKERKNLHEKKSGNPGKPANKPDIEKQPRETEQPVTKEKDAPNKEPTTVVDKTISAEPGEMETDTFPDDSDTAMEEILYEDTSEAGIDSGFIDPDEVSLTDTLTADTAIEGTGQAESHDVPPSNYEIRREELINSSKVPIVSLDTNKTTRLPKSDSLLQELSDIKESVLPSTMVVEFWESPINYRGYKMANRKLVLFGFEYYPSQTKIYSLKGELFLVYLGQVYRLTETYDFRPYRTVSDPDVLNKLK